MKGILKILRKSNDIRIAPPSIKTYIIFKKDLFIYFWLHWVLVAAYGLSLVAASRGYSSLQCVAFSCGGFSCGAWAPGAWASVIVAHRLSCSLACVESSQTKD